MTVFTAVFSASAVVLAARGLRRIASLSAVLFVLTAGAANGGLAAGHLPAATPPMGWNDWAHYECGFTAKTILDNAHALVTTGLAAHGYNTVTIDDCWMLKERDAKGDLQVDPQRFPQGMRPVADEVHRLGLKFGIYEDAGYLTCGGFAGSGEPKDGGKDHFLQDAKLFTSWGVDYLKLDGCNVYVPQGEDMNTAYRKAYAEESKALAAVGGKIVFSESAPAYFQGDPAWYDVLAWVRGYGQLWREGSDIFTYSAKHPEKPRFHSVLWNYAYNLPLARYQKPGNWNDADFIIGGDSGMTRAESRSQLSLWAMMSAPLILSSNLPQLSAGALAMLENKAVLAVDQDALGKEASLIKRTPAMDLLFKALTGGDYAVAILNRGASPMEARVLPQELGFAGKSCSLQAKDVWDGAQSSGGDLRATIATHDTVLWRVHPSSSCGSASRTGAVTAIVAKGEEQDSATYGRCLSAQNSVGACTGAAAELWTFTANGALRSGDQCLASAAGNVAMRPCNASTAQRWHYALSGNLISGGGKCLTAQGPDHTQQTLGLEICGHNLSSQVWSLPNG